jgi:hypothetical protein
MMMMKISIVVIMVGIVIVLKPVHIFCEQWAVLIAVARHRPVVIVVNITKKTKGCESENDQTFGCV